MKRQKSYTSDYRQEAVKLVLEQGLSATESAKRLGMPKATLNSWIQAAKGLSASKAGVAPGARSILELEAELVKLRRELREARMESDILKKAAAYFARGSLPSMRT